MGVADGVLKCEVVAVFLLRPSWHVAFEWVDGLLCRVPSLVEQGVVDVGVDLVLVVFYCPPAPFLKGFWEVWFFCEGGSLSQL